MKNQKEIGELGNYGCDKCASEIEETVRLATGGDGGIFLCSKCWPLEMAWRKERNKSLAPASHFTIAPFPKEGK